MGLTSSHAGKRGQRGGQQILSHLGRRAVPPNIPEAMIPPSRQWLIGPWPPRLPLMCGASARRFCLLGSAPEETIYRSIWGDAWVAAHSCCSQGSGSANLFVACSATLRTSCRDGEPGCRSPRQAALFLSCPGTLSLLSAPGITGDLNDHYPPWFLREAVFGALDPRAGGYLALPPDILRLSTRPSALLAAPATLPAHRVC